MELIKRTVAARILGVSERTISNYVRYGYLKAHYVFDNGKHYLVDIEEVKKEAEMMSDRVEGRRLAQIERMKKQPQPRHGNKWIAW